MKEILIGTHNCHKAKEIADLLAGLPLQIRTLNDFPNIPPAIEDGKTLEENALKKALGYATKSGLFTIADDTGLEVKALHGAPGVYSARFAGEACSYKDNNKKLIQLLAQESDRSATFRCVIACIDLQKKFEKMVEGRIEGVILKELKGTQGFGYDSVFYVPKCKKTFAEMSLEEKNRVSHRALAVQKLKELLLKQMELCRVS